MLRDRIHPKRLDKQTNLGATLLLRRSGIHYGRSPIVFGTFLQPWSGLTIEWTVAYRNPLPQVPATKTGAEVSAPDAQIGTA